MSCYFGEAAVLLSKLVVCQWYVDKNAKLSQILTGQALWPKRYVESETGDRQGTMERLPLRRNEGHETDVERDFATIQGIEKQEYCTCVANGSIVARKEHRAGRRRRSQHYHI